MNIKLTLVALTSFLLCFSGLSTVFRIFTNFFLIFFAGRSGPENCLLSPLSSSHCVCAASQPHSLWPRPSGVPPTRTCDWLKVLPLWFQRHFMNSLNKIKFLDLLSSPSIVPVLMGSFYEDVQLVKARRAPIGPEDCRFEGIISHGSDWMLSLPSADDVGQPSACLLTVSRAVGYSCTALFARWRQTGNRVWDRFNVRVHIGIVPGLFRFYQAPGIRRTWTPAIQLRGWFLPAWQSYKRRREWRKQSDSGLYVRYSWIVRNGVPCV